ncbi:MAG: hypothetical protein GEV10_25650 [Streptosporangiales bacterium]|nr:hypothetical protein [Streptosporangiales bacterium]
MRLSTFLLVTASMFVLVMGSCGAMGMSFTQGGDASTASVDAGGARPPGAAGGDVAAPTANCAADIRQQGLPASMAPEGQSRSTHLTPRSQNVRSQVEEKFDGRFESIGGWRPGPDAYSDDHGCGRALDVMISGLGKASNAEQTANGFAISSWAIANAKVLGVHYIIFQQCIWNVQRASESGCGNVPAGTDAKGWRSMSSRGSNTQNHYDHVHISMW